MGEEHPIQKGATQVRFLLPLNTTMLVTLSELDSAPRLRPRCSFPSCVSYKYAPALATCYGPIEGQDPGPIKEDRHRFGILFPKLMFLNPDRYVS